MKPLICLGIALSAVLLFTPAHAGKVYKWVDQDGVTHYDEQPPANREYTTVTTYGNAPSGAKAANERLDQQRTEQSEENKKAIDYEKEKKIRDEEARVLAENCNNAKANLKTMEENARVRVLGDDGQFRYLSEEEKQAQMDQAKDIIKESCKN